MVSRPKTTDLLLGVVEEIRTHAEEEGFIVFYREECAGGSKDTFNWHEEHGGDWKRFLACAKAMAVRTVYLSWLPFEGWQVDDALEDVALPGDETSERKKAELEAYNQQVETYREKVGLTAVIELAFVAEAVFHICEITADWFRAFEELTTEEEGRGEEIEKEKKVDKALVYEWAGKLASHPKYGSCKSDDQREYLLEKLAGEEYEKLPLGDILRRAETVYQFEVRPEVEERLRDQARALRKQGLNMSAIALKLGISANRVSGLLAE